MQQPYIKLVSGDTDPAPSLDPVLPRPQARQERLAFLIPNLGGGGVQKNTLTLAKGLLAAGFPVDLLICADRGPLRSQVPPDMNLVRLMPTARWRSRLLSLRAGSDYWLPSLRPLLLARKPSRTLPFLPSLVDYLAQRKPAALLTATAHLNIEAVLAKRISRAATRVVVTQSHHLSRWQAVSGEWRRRFLLPLLGRAYRDADAVVAVSGGVADDLAATLGLHRAAIDVVHNPVVTPELLQGVQQPVDHPWFRDGGPPVILTVARPGRQKDFHTLFRAFARVHQQRRARLLVLGEARDPDKRQRRKAALLEYTEQLGIQDDIDFQGFVHNPYSYMAGAAVFVLSSRYEGFGNVLAEALACGCPVVSSDCPSGPAEILDGGRYGELVPVGDDAAMAAAILRQLDSPADPAGQQKYARRFALEPVARVYQSLLAPERQVQH